MMKKIACLISTFFILQVVSAQDQHLELYNPEVGSFGPSFISQSEDSTISKSSFYPKQRLSRIAPKEDRSWIHRKTFKEHFFNVHSSKDPRYYLEVDPLFNFQVGQDFKSNNSTEILYTNTRGFRISGSVNERVGFVSTFLENQSRFPLYLQNYVALYNVVPGQGRVKRFKEQDFDYASASGHVYINATNWMDIQFGHGKHKIGQGYRSLILSENSFNYPFLRTNFSWGKGVWNYSIMFSSLQDLERIPIATDTEPLFSRKTANYHYFSLNPAPKFRLGLVDATIVKNVSESGLQTYYFEQINPFPFSNFFTSESKDNIDGIIALEMDYLIKQGLEVYTQLIHKKVNSNGLQIGLKWWENNRWMILAEANYIGENLYSDTGISYVYAHYNQFLSLPRGYEGIEFVTMAQYKMKRWFALLKFIAADAVVDHKASGENINHLLTNNVSAHEMALGYFINEANGMQVRLSYYGRNDKDSNINNAKWLAFSFRTFLPQSFYDF